MNIFQSLWMSYVLQFSWNQWILQILLFLCQLRILLPQKSDETNFSLHLIIWFQRISEWIRIFAEITWLLWGAMGNPTLRWKTKIFKLIVIWTFDVNKVKIFHTYWFSCWNWYTKASSSRCYWKKFLYSIQEENKKRYEILTNMIGGKWNSFELLVMIFQLLSFSFWIEHYFNFFSMNSQIRKMRKIYLRCNDEKMAQNILDGCFNTLIRISHGLWE